MLNVLIPMAGRTTFSINESSQYPKILTDVEGKLLLERAAESFINISCDKKITVVIPEKQINDYKLNKVFSLLDSSIGVFSISGETQGAACSCLLALEELELDSPLIISSFEQVLDVDLNYYLNEFLNDDVDAGVLTFDAIHPKWSYVKTDLEGYVTQAVEKQPISRHAIAGFYFFKTAGLFVESVKNMVRNDVKYNDLFYISPSLNEVIIREGRVKALPISKEKYVHIQDQHALENYEEKIVSKTEDSKILIKNLTVSYVEAFDSGSLINLDRFFSSGFHLTDPYVSLKGKENVLSYLSDFFKNNKSISFIATNIIVNGNVSVIEFILSINGVNLVGTDVIYWNDDFKMIAINAYLYEKK